MGWKCACKAENVDESVQCNNCGRKKPKYLGVKLELAPTEKMNDDQFAVWYLMMAYDHLIDAEAYLKSYEETKEKLGDQTYNQVKIQELINNNMTKIEYNCEKCFSILEIAMKHNPKAQLRDKDDAIQDIPSIKSNCYFLLGNYYFEKEHYDHAIANYQQSYEADLNQVSIYNIAMATMNLPVEGGGFFGGKKKEAAMQAKKEQEIDLLQKVIKFSPFSRLGIQSGRRLIHEYGITEFDI